ncbi:MAG: NUDIX hydrolase [Candidatus Harrisonbacteria bacterium]|nr:NUDIX hydrolase [Candidatus Harrisonbacteria bacterium]
MMKKRVVIRLWDGGREHVLMLLRESKDGVYKHRNHRKLCWVLPQTKILQFESPREAAMRALEEMGVGAAVKETHSDVIYTDDKEVFLFDAYNSGQLPQKLGHDILTSNWVYVNWLIPGHPTYGRFQGYHISRRQIRDYILRETLTAPQ